MFCGTKPSLARRASSFFTASQHSYCSFLATDPADKLDLLTETRALTPDETESLVDALAAGWCDRLPGGKLDDRQRGRLHDLVQSLVSASKVPEPQQPEELRKSLNRSMGNAGRLRPIRCRRPSWRYCTSAR